MGVSDFGSLPRCTTIGCPLHMLTRQINFHLALLHTHTKTYNNEGFISPRQTAKRVLFENPSFQINLENRFSLPTTINSSEFPALPTQQTTAQQNAQAGGTTSSSTAANMNTTQTGVTPSSQKPGLTNTSTQGVQPRVTPRPLKIIHPRGASKSIPTIGNGADCSTRRAGNGAVT
ncbi:hypothetical protein TNCV_694601 [Trichonephila clavipes]|nr:hypothetical protein TNCV_694601 [Trichonephila clavipes]